MSTSTGRGGRPRSDARTAEILWAAAQLFARQGVAATTTREIAATAQTTERTLFKHFGSKEALVRAVLEEAVLAHLAPLSLQGLTAAISHFAGDLQAWHRALLSSRLQALATAPELTRLLVAELLRDAKVREHFATHWRPAVWEPLLALFSQLQRSGELRRDVTAEQLVRQFLGVNVGFLLSRLLLASDLAWNDEAEITAIARVFASGAHAP
ncbi:MAG TPA: helix-turn-helix domain-containing protein [Ramlibacter sp.]|jgi:AcrR family transcriptional regulator|nr:helix-turn-helix domain-containing protein [Ramlibacter sp.]